MKRLACACFFLVFCVFFAGAALAAEAAKPALAGAMALPAPETSGGPGVLEALNKRASASGAAFPAGELSAEDLSTLLWAASGRNRGDKGWTVPTAMGRAPYCDVYVLKSDGAFLYLWKNHSLKRLSAADSRGVVPSQAFAQNAPVVLVFVAKAEALAEFKEPERKLGYASVLVGAMTQNVYLAGQARNIGGRYIVSFNPDAVRAALKLPAGDAAVCVMPLGRF